MTVPPTTRALLHQLRGATQAYVEILADVRDLLSDEPALAGVNDQLTEALRERGSMGSPRSLLDSVNEAIARLGEV